VFCVKILTFCEAKDGFVFPALTNETDKALRNKFDLKKKKKLGFNLFKEEEGLEKSFLREELKEDF